MEDIALVQRQLRCGAFVDNCAELRGGGINHGRRASDFHHVRGTANLQHYIDADSFVEVEGNAFARVFLETLARKVNFIGTNGHFEENIFAISAGLHVACSVRGFVD